jgi:pyridoxal 5'-phosphate synthase pdxT subunit
MAGPTDQAPEHQNQVPELVEGTPPTPTPLPARRNLAMSRTPTVGVLALQGGVSEHVELLQSLEVRTTALRTPADLLGPDGLRVDAVVLPGGESSVIDRLLRTFGLFEPLRAAIAGGLPTLGTCAGLILLANRVEDPAPGQQSLAVLEATVRRNAFGSQVDSAEVSLETVDGPVTVAFIRAPMVVAVGPDAEVIARRGDAVVGVRQGGVTGIAFHPELTGEARFHRRLLAEIGAGSRGLAR